MAMLSTAGEWIWIGAAAVAVLWLPGMVLSEVLGQLGADDACRDPIASVGLSMACTPLVALYLALCNVAVDRAVVIAAYSLCGALALMAQVIRRPPRGSAALAHVALGASSHNRSAGLCLIVAFGATMILRFVQVRDLVLPAWVDSLHHTLIVQALGDQGRVPDFIASYDPVPFYYHFGFHILASVFGELAGLPPARAILVLGQVLSSVVVLAVYRLATELTCCRRTALVAAVLTAVVSQMPAYYTSWGRYTLLTGMALLPIAMAAAVNVWRKPERPGYGLLLALLSGGLVLTHYVTAAFLWCFLIVLPLVKVDSESRVGWPHRILAVAAWSSLGPVVAAPWLIRVMPHVVPLISVRVTGGATAANQASVVDVEYLWYLVNRPRSLAVLILAALSGLPLVNHRQSVKVLWLWFVVLAVLSSDWLWQVRPFRADLTLICLFLPGNILAAETVVGIRRLFGVVTRGRLVPRMVLGIILATAITCAFVDTISIINPASVLATPADLEAMGWIEQNTPVDARFLINVERWSSKAYRGTDGGWWIPLLARRSTILPPGVFHVWGDPGYLREVRAVAEQARAIDGCTTAFWSFVRRYRVTHIYIGPGRGTLQPRWFDSCAGVTRVYMGRNVHIYEVSSGRARVSGAQRR